MIYLCFNLILLNKIGWSTLIMCTPGNGSYLCTQVTVSLSLTSSVTWALTCGIWTCWTVHVDQQTQLEYSHVEFLLSFTAWRNPNWYLTYHIQPLLGSQSLCLSSSEWNKLHSGTHSDWKVPAWRPVPDGCDSQGGWTNESGFEASLQKWYVTLPHIFYNQASLIAKPKFRVGKPNYW